MLEILLYLVLFNVGSVLVFLWLKGKAKNPYTLVLTAIFLFTLFSLLQDPPSLIGGIASVVSASFFLFVPFLLTILIQKAVKTRRYRLAAFFTRLLDITLLRKPDGTSEALLETALAREGKGEPVIRKVEESIRNARNPREQYMLFRKLLLLLVAAEKYEKVISLFLENEHPMRPMPGEPFGSSLIEALAEKGRFPEIPDVFVAMSHTNRNVRSPEEAELVAQLIAEAVACGVPPDEIAVVVPYRAQARLIRSKVTRLSSNGTYNPVVIDTVERIQGQERDVILVSLTTSDPGHAAMQAEFFFRPNRLNVAITRARSKRIVIGSPALFRTTARNAQLRQWISFFEQLYQSSNVISLNGSS